MTNNSEPQSALAKIDFGLVDNTCPKCGNAILPMQAIGTGDPADGRFCSFNCLVRFNPFAASNSIADSSTASGTDNLE